MKCLVTGGTGFLGRHLVHHLQEQGHDVRVLARKESRLIDLGDAEVVVGDVLDPASLEAATAGAEVVFHLAGRVAHKGEPTDLFQLHVDGTRNALAAAKAAKVARFVHMSTSGTIAVSKDPARVADEGASYAVETVRRWPYYLSKIYAEKIALEADLPVVVLNPSLLLGPGDEGFASSQVILRFLRRELPAVPPGGINFVDVRDAAAATVAAATAGSPGERYLLGGPNMTLDAFFVLLSKVTGIPCPAMRAAATLNDAAATVLGALEDVGGFSGDESVAYAMGGHTWYLDARKAQRELNFRARSPEATLRDAVAWIRSRGPLPEESGTFGSLFRGVQRVLGRV